MSGSMSGSMSSCGTFAGRLIELGELRAGAGRGDCNPGVFDQPATYDGAQSRTAPLGQVFDQEHHSMPARFQLVGDAGDLGDVIGDGNCVASDSSKHREIPCRREIGTQEPAVSDFEFDPKQSVKDFNRSLLRGRAQLVLPSPLRTDLISIDCSESEVTELLDYLSRNVFGLDRSNADRQMRVD